MADTIQRKQIIYPVRNESNDEYPILNIPVNYQIPPDWIEIFPTTSKTDELTNETTNYDINSFKFENGEWIDDLDYIKKVQKKKMNAIRWEKERESFDFNGFKINCDDVSQTKINGAVSSVLVDSTYTLNWRCDDGTFVTLNGDYIKALGTAVRNHIQTQFDKEKDYNTLIDNKTTREEIESINWED